LNAIALILRIYSYLYELALALFFLAISIVASSGSNSLSLPMLPWTGESLTHWLLGLSLIGIVSTLLAMTGWFRYLFPIWALVVLVLMVKGLFLGSYGFSGPEEFRGAVWLTVGALGAFLSSLIVLKKPVRKF
jgi:hypothetical protein